VGAVINVANIITVGTFKKKSEFSEKCKFFVKRAAYVK